MDLLRREIAPITDEAWARIDQEAKTALKAHLSARYFVDFSGPHGWAFGAVNTGRLHLPAGKKKEAAGGVHWGQRVVVPLLEVRVPFHMKNMELDYIPRGAQDIDWSPLEEAARQVTLFEETAVYQGFGDGGIEGIFGRCRHAKAKIGPDPDQIMATVAQALEMLRESQVEGPYVLVLGPAAFETLNKLARNGYPLRQNIVNVIPEVSILWSPAMDGGALLSARGGDFELTVGQDLSIGYCAHDRDQVELYFTESFAFRVLEDEAAVVLDWKKG